MLYTRNFFNSLSYSATSSFYILKDTPITQAEFLVMLAELASTFQFDVIVCTVISNLNNILNILFSEVIPIQKHKPAVFAMLNGKLL